MTPKSLIEPARHAGTALLRSQSDARLVDLMRDGNERAFEAIVHRYRRPLLRYCARLLSPARAEDAVQQAFLSAHRGIHAGTAELNLRPWLYRIAHNAALHLLRQNGYDHDQVSEDIDGVETPPHAFERGERLRTVVAAVRELPERQRSAIVLQALEGRSYQEIAAELGVSDGAVRQLLNRARNTLREAAAAITPTGLLTRLAATGGDSSVAERVAQVVAGTGGGALVLKTGTALIVAGALTGGAVTGNLPGTGAHRHGGGAQAAGANAPAQAGAAGSSPAAAPSAHRANVALTTGGGGSGHAVQVRNLATGPGGRRHRGGGSGSGHGGDHAGSSGDGGASGHGGGDHSGNGSDGSGRSGSGGGDGSGSRSGDHSHSGDASHSPGAGDHSGSRDDRSSHPDSGSPEPDDGTPATAVVPPAISGVSSNSGKGSGADKWSSPHGDGTSPDDGSSGSGRPPH